MRYALKRALCTLLLMLLIFGSTVRPVLAEETETAPDGEAAGALEETG